MKPTIMASSSPHHRRKMACKMLGLLAVACASLASYVCWSMKETPAVSAAFWHHRRLSDVSENRSSTRLYLVYDTSSLTQTKFVHDLTMEVTTTAEQSLSIQAVSNTADQQSFLKQHCPESETRFTELMNLDQISLATELYKYCALQQTDGTVTTATLWIDATAMESMLLVRLSDLMSTLQRASSVSALVLGNTPSTIHGSIVLLNERHQSVARSMLQQLVQIPLEHLVNHPLVISQTLYDLVETNILSHEDESATNNLDKNTFQLGVNPQGWYLLEQTCQDTPTTSLTSSGSSSSISFLENSVTLDRHTCTSQTPCCKVTLNERGDIVFWTKYVTLPIFNLDKLIARLKPCNSELGHFQPHELPYITTIHEQVNPKPEGYTPAFAKNMFDILVANQCLPDNKDCAKCLHNKSGANCRTCAQVCNCYCKTLCKELPPPKFIAKTLTAHPPVLPRDPGRLVPRIIHQTYFEELTPDKYPNMSRMVESFKQSGWEYRFYSDEDAQNFLSTHFPLEVREAYDALRPGAFKADLFRYCALFVFGGVYSDVDILLESNLDLSIPNDVGFIVPIDEPGKEANVPMCVWNGFIASAPAHPFLAKAIETVVNQIQNRFTSVDYVASFCPDPELSVLYAFDTLFTAGPCALGAAMNRVLGRPGQTPFTPGQLVAPDEKALAKATSFVLTDKSLSEASAAHSKIPGKTVLLHQDKWDMGAHRFTLPSEYNHMIVAATDLPDADDRESVTSNAKQTEHYSKTHASVGIYGLEHLYKDSHRANEDLAIVIQQSPFQRLLETSKPAAAKVE